jgi:hypothetical protein
VELADVQVVVSAAEGKGEEDESGAEVLPPVVAPARRSYLIPRACIWAPLVVSGSTSITALCLASYLVFSDGRWTAYQSGALAKCGDPAVVTAIHAVLGTWIATPLSLAVAFAVVGVHSPTPARPLTARGARTGGGAAAVALVHP